ncbi:Gfo/Idh/MocA family protein [Cellulomonas hominis]
MRLAVLGSGQIVQYLLPVVTELHGVDVHAIFGPEAFRDQLEQLSARHDIARIYTDYAECLADPDVDTVYVGLPNHLHFEFAKDALAAGKHVVCEKPFTTSLAELDELRELAETAGLILVEAITNQYQSSYLQAKAALAELGKVRLVQCSYTQASSRYGAFTAGQTPAAFDPARGGGALMDLGIYTIHFVVGLLGRPSAVSYWANVQRGIDTSGVLVLDYGDCKAVCALAKDSGAPNRQVLQAEHGTIVMEAKPNICGPYTVLRDSQEPRTFDHTLNAHRMYEEFVEFERMIRDRDLDRRDAGLAHSRTVLEIALEARSGLERG